MDEYLLSRISDRSIKVKTVGGPQSCWTGHRGRRVGSEAVFFHSHRIHGTGIFTYIWLKCMVNVGKYATHGYYGIVSAASLKLTSCNRECQYRSRACFCGGFFRMVRGQSDISECTTGHGFVVEKSNHFKRSCHHGWVFCVNSQPEQVGLLILHVHTFSTEILKKGAVWTLRDGGFSALQISSRKEDMGHFCRNLMGLMLLLLRPLRPLTTRTYW